jgi:hypothetical protein
MKEVEKQPDKNSVLLEKKFLELFIVLEKHFWNVVVSHLGATTLSLPTFSLTTLCIINLHYGLSIECHYAVRHFFIVMFSVTMLNVVMLSVVAPLLVLPLVRYY